MNDKPFDETTRSRRHSLLDEPRGRQPGEQREYPQDAIRPLGTNALYQRSQREACYGASQSATGKNDAICESSLAAKVLGRRHGHGDEAQADAQAQQDAAGGKQSCNAVDGEAAQDF